MSKKVKNRSSDVVSGQIEHWEKIGKIAEESPDLNYELIKDILIAQQEAENDKLKPYYFEKKTR